MNAGRVAWLVVVVVACAGCDAGGAPDLARDVARVARARGADLAGLRCRRARSDGSPGVCVAAASRRAVSALAAGLALESGSPLERAAVATPERGGCVDEPGFHAPAAVELFAPTARTPAASGGLGRVVLAYSPERGAACIEVERVAP